MTDKPKKAIDNPTAFDRLASIWILASNDEYSLISYRGITYRLGLPDDFDVKALIKSRPEMFRHGVRDSRLAQWKHDMHSGKHLPSWIRETEDAKRLDAIDTLTTDDIFRSQFRTQPGAEQSKIEIIEWGLAHLERLREAETEEREQKTKRITAWLPLASVIVPLFSLLVSMYLAKQTLEIQRSSIETQIALKKFELSYRPRLEAYLAFEEAQREVVDAADKHDIQATMNSSKKFNASLPALQLFLTNQESRNILGRQFSDVSRYCENFANPANDNSEKLYKCYDAASKTSSTLGPALFPEDLSK